MMPMNYFIVFLPTWSQCIALYFFHLMPVEYFCSLPSLLVSMNWICSLLMPMNHFKSLLQALPSDVHSSGLRSKSPHNFSLRGVTSGYDHSLGNPVEGSTGACVLLWLGQYRRVTSLVGLPSVCGRSGCFSLLYFVCNLNRIFCSALLRQ